MRVGYFEHSQRILARSAALLMVGGLAAGCSSGMTRFSDDIFTGSTTNQRTILRADNQPYPGDRAKPAPVNGAYTESASRDAVTPAPISAPVTRSSLPPVGNSAPAPQPMPAPIAAAPAKPMLDRAPTGSVAAVKPVPVSQDMPKEGWTRNGGTEVTLQEGESITTLSKRFGVPAKAILKVNGIADGTARPGQKIVIPTYVRAPRPADAQKLAEKPAGKPADAPAPGQKTDGNLAVLPAQPKLKEPDGQPASTDGNLAPASPKTAGNTYTVVSGDTLYGVAKKTGTKAEALRAANGLTTGELKIGQKLKIPGAGAVQKVSAAAPVDPIVTGTAGTQKPKAAEKVSVYTPPTKVDKQISDANASSNEEAPDATGIGKMRWPVRGRVVGTYGSANNDGIDISVPEGTPVKAAENGVVIYAGDGLKDFGKTVLVRHSDGKVTVYGHTSEIKVNRGDTVKRGQEIARSGMTGKTDAPKLHFEVRENSQPVDPKQFLE